MLPFGSNSQNVSTLIDMNSEKSMQQWVEATLWNCQHSLIWTLKMLVIYSGSSRKLLVLSGINLTRLCFVALFGSSSPKVLILFDMNSEKVCSIAWCSLTRKKCQHCLISLFVGNSLKILVLINMNSANFSAVR